MRSPTTARSRARCCAPRSAVPRCCEDGSCHYRFTTVRGYQRRREDDLSAITPAARPLDFSDEFWVARHSETLQPNWLRNHREKALRAENPSRSEIDVRSRLLIYRVANSARTASMMDENVCPSRARCRCKVRRFSPNRFATLSIEQRPDGSIT